MEYKLIQAKNMKQAMIKIHQEMGPNAMIYKTRNRVGGIEVLAGVQGDSDQLSDDVPSTTSCQLVASGNTDLVIHDNRFDKLNAKIEELTQHLAAIKTKKGIKESILSYIQTYLPVVKKYCSKKVAMNAFYLLAKNKVFYTNAVLSRLNINKQYKLRSPEDDVFDKQTIRALVGPTGVGKTTTIIKIASHFSSKYDLTELGIISTNIDDLYIENKLNHYCKIYQVDYTHVRSLDELNEALEKMAEKKLVLIDTHGIAQRDEIAINKQRMMLEKSNYNIKTYITMSASQQTEVIEDNIRHFTFKKIAGCILTKVDEALRIEPALEIINKCNLSVAYLCNGENLDGDMYSLSEEYHQKAAPLEMLPDLGIRSLNTQSANWI